MTPISSAQPLSRVDLTHHAIVALGANLGDPLATLPRAFASLESLSSRPVLRSSLWRTSPVDCPPNAPVFLNAIAILTPFPAETPESLLARLQALERDFGRQPKQALNEPRPLDLDLIAFRLETRNTPALILPHPRAHQRRFVLAPLAELDPDLHLPGWHRSVAELLAGLNPAETACRM